MAQNIWISLYSFTMKAEASLLLAEKELLKISWLQIFHTCTPTSNSFSCIGGWQKFCGASYYSTNLVSAETFIIDLTAKPPSIGEKDFDNNMQAARLCREAIPTHQINERRSYTAMDM